MLLNTESKMQEKSSKVCVVGLGYVGLPLALLAARKGYKTIGLDVNEDRVKRINAKEAIFTEEALNKQFQDTTLTATTDASVATDADIIVICVPTPVHHDFSPDLSPVIGACKGVGQYLSKGQLVILESTVNPGVCEDVVIPELEKASGLRVGEDFMLAHCPERINPGDSNWTVENIPRVVGGYDAESLEAALDFYRSIVGADIKPMGSLKEAEAVKVVENTFRDINIAFVNELAMSFNKLGIDVVNVIQGASTKPFAFMPHFPSCGVGGHCIPVDPHYLINYAKQNGFDHEFLTLARKINRKMPEFTVNLVVEKLRQHGLPLIGTKVALLGLAYKSDIDDDRESPSYEILHYLQSLGIEPVTYDPYVRGGTAESLEEALKDAKVALIATDHKQFRSLKPEDFSKHGIKIIIDGKNCLPKAEFISAGITYQGIGR